MLDERVVSLARKTASTQLGDLDHPFTMTIAGWKSKLHGYGQLFVYMMRAYDQEIARRAEVIWSNFHRAHGSHGSQISPGLRADLLGVFREDLNAMVESLRPRFDADMKGSSAGAKAPSWSEQLAAARDRELARYEAEIEHYVSNLEAAAARGAPAGASYVIHGHVGAIVSGAGASANVVQNINPEQREALLKALDIVQQAIAAAPEIRERDRIELVEITKEAAGEIGKESPNTRRLGFALQTLAAAVQGIASALGAYEVLRGAAAAVGI